MSKHRLGANPHASTVTDLKHKMYGDAVPHKNRRAPRSYEIFAALGFMIVLLATIAAIAATLGTVF